jgi:hypothetical protein
VAGSIRAVYEGIGPEQGAADGLGDELGAFLAFRVSLALEPADLAVLIVPEGNRAPRSACPWSLVPVVVVEKPGVRPLPLLGLVLVTGALYPELLVIVHPALEAVLLVDDM